MVALPAHLAQKGFVVGSCGPERSDRTQPTCVAVSGSLPSPWQLDSQLWLRGPPALAWLIHHGGRNSLLRMTRPRFRIGPDRTYKVSV